MWKVQTFFFFLKHQGSGVHWEGMCVCMCDPQALPLAPPLSHLTIQRRIGNEGVKGVQALHWAGWCSPIWSLLTWWTLTSPFSCRLAWSSFKGEHDGGGKKGTSWALKPLFSLIDQVSVLQMLGFQINNPVDGISQRELLDDVIWNLICFLG